jgi:SAM-dependent methyltransferase
LPTPDDLRQTAPMHRTLYRIATVLYRARYGLPLRGAGIAGPFRTDLWASQISIYRAAARWAADADVVEVGCLAGDGLAELRASTPRSLRGYDGDPRLVAAGQRRFGLDLTLADLDALPDDPRNADLLLAINVLQRARDARAALAWLARRRRSAGRVVVSVPQIVDEGTMAMHRAVPGHHTHLFVWEWELQMRERFPDVAIYRHLPPAGATLDFTSPKPSSWRPEQFELVEIAPAEIDELGGLGVVFVGGGGP